MPTTKELRDRLKRARTSLREAETALLTERQREQELRRAYNETQLVSNAALPLHLQKNG